MPSPATPKLRLAILDDYQNVALSLADWSAIENDVDISVFNGHLGDTDAVAQALQGFDIIAAMRERTPFPKTLFDKLPALKLLMTTGMVNRSIDLDAAKARGVTVCGTGSFGNPTAGIAWGLILELTRHIGYENARLKAGEPWQTTLGPDVEGLTLGVIGLGKLGTRVGRIALAFGMKVVVWSANITPERAAAAGFGYAATKEDLLRQSDIVTIHIPLTPSSRGLLGAPELALLKPTALLINTSRGPIIDQAAMLDVLRHKRIAGAGFDVYDIEPLPTDHPVRKLDNVVLTPHLGYVSEQNYRQYFKGIVEDVRGFLDGKPVRVLGGEN
jgi:D-3-phosphoglycerate dehydrogenase